MKLIILLSFGILGFVSTKQYYIQQVKANWYAAYESCRRQGLQLATINSAAEESDLERQMTQLGLHDTWMWTSGTDQQQADVSDYAFIWFSTGQPFTYTKWTETQPWNYDGRELCVHVWPVKGQIGWNDWHCNETIFYICEDTPCSGNNNNNGCHCGCGNCGSGGNGGGVVSNLLTGLL